MKATKSAVIAAATVAATIALPATGRADSYYYFQSPSGNIACDMSTGDNGAGDPVCKIKDHTWEVPVEPVAAGGTCEYSGPDLKLFQGAPPCAGVWPSQIWMLHDNNTLPTLAYGQTHSVGVMTCDSEPSSVTCTDTSTGHFFRISRDSYQLG
jgi:hypothetical protein